MELASLRIADLKSVPIWRYEYSNGKELIEKTDMTELSDSKGYMISDHDYTHIVLTEYCLNNKAIFWGYSSIEDACDMEYVEPVIILENKHLNFWKAHLNGTEGMQSFLSELGYTESEVFPIKAKSLVMYNGQTIHMIITSFRNLISSMYDKSFQETIT